MATPKQKEAIKILVENRGKPISQAMREAGYDETTVKNPKNLTQSKAWGELMDKHLPDDLLMKRHKELLNKKETVVVRDEDGAHVEITDQPDTQAVKAGLDMAYKLKGKYPKNQDDQDTPRSVFAFILTQIQNGGPRIVTNDSQPTPGSSGDTGETEQPLLETEQSILDQR